MFARQPAIEGSSERLLFVLLVILFCLPLLLFSAGKILSPAPPEDFLGYWAAGRLFLMRQNPYSAANLMMLERPLGWTHAGPQVMLCPPWSLPAFA